MASLAILFLVSAFTSYFVVLAATTNGSKGLRIDLINKYSEASPMRQANLTNLERYAEMLELSYARASRLSSLSSYANGKSPVTKNGAHIDYITPDIDYLGDSIYMVHVYIGTNTSPDTYENDFYLDFDTAGNLIWTQCVGCDPCFPILHGSFDRSKSSTLQPYLPYFHHDYGDGSYAEGIVLKDVFAFQSSQPGHGTESAGNIFFGCGLKNQVTWGANTGPRNMIAGIFGMGKGVDSFFTQFGNAGEGEGRFSYCLTYWKDFSGASKLWFGPYANNFPPHSDVRTTPLVVHHAQDDKFYYVNLLGISVDGAVLPIPPSTFGIHDDGSGGMIVDTGSATTWLYEVAHQLLLNRLDQIFSANGLHRIQISTGHEARSKWGKESLTYCWDRRRNFNNFPVITFHFEGADFEHDPKGAFLIDENFFCLQMASEVPNGLAILGAFGMANNYITIDIGAMTMSFAKTNCLINP